MPKKAKPKERAEPKAGKAAAPRPALAKGPGAAAPRLGALLPEAKIDKVPTGIPGLDKLTEGGFEPKSVVIVSGGPGTGKSTLGLQFLYDGAMRGESGMYLCFEEEKETVYRHMLRYGWDFAKLEREKKFAFVSYPPEEIARFIAEGGIIEDLLGEFGVKRIVVDTVTSFLMIHDDEYKRRQAFIKLMGALRRWGCTTLLISEGEMGPGGEMHTHFDIEFVSDGLIDLQMVRKGSSAEVMMEIIKMRGIAFAHTRVPLGFTKRGLAVAARKG